jgi:protein NRD1
MSSAVAELEAALQAMLLLKPPGVSGSKITTITNLCNANVQVSWPILRCPCYIFRSLATDDPFSQSESVLIQKLYTHFKKAPGTHKLGVLYVVDSVTRKWTEQAKNAGQPINSSAQDGTFAAGVHRVKELLPVLMNDIIQSSPDDQKVRPNMSSVVSIQKCSCEGLMTFGFLDVARQKSLLLPCIIFFPFELPLTLFFCFVGQDQKAR